MGGEGRGRVEGRRGGGIPIWKHGPVAITSVFPACCVPGVLLDDELLGLQFVEAQ